MASGSSELGRGRPKRVVLVGTYNSSNKGDAAMQLTAAAQIQRCIPNAEVTISTPFPTLDAPFYSPLPVVRSDRRRLVWGTGELLRAWLFGLAGRRSGLDLGKLVPEPELRALREADLVVDLSGDMMTEDYGPHVAYSHFIPVLLAAFLRRPYVLCAQSIGPFKLTLPLARYVLDQAEWVTVRDELTLDYLRQLGLRQQRLEFTADLAFLLDPVPAQDAQRLLAAEGVSNGSKPLLGVSVSQLVESHFQRRNPEGRTSAFVEVVAQALDELALKLDCELLFVSHVTGPSRPKDDRIISRSVRQKLTAKAHVLEGDYGPAQLKGMISQCHAFFGARMHANIAALSSGVPVVALAYSHKTPGVMRLLGQQDFLLDIAELSPRNLVEKVSRLWSERDARATQLQQRVPDLQARSRRNIDLIGETLAADKPSAVQQPTPPVDNSVERPHDQTL